MRWRLLCCLLVSLTGQARGEDFFEAFTPLSEDCCLACHDGDTKTKLNLEALSRDLSQPDVFRQWVQIYDRVRLGEMPPPDFGAAEEQQRDRALAALQPALHQQDAARQQRYGRVPARRLTKRELNYTLQDLFGLQADVTRSLPDEVEAGSFDTVGSTQRISAVHMESYLEAAEETLSLAVQLGTNPYREQDTDYAWLSEWHDKPVNLGGNVTRPLEEGPGIALFRDIDYLTAFQFAVTVPGPHRLTARLAAYQSATPVTAKFLVKRGAGGARLVKTVDLAPQADPVSVSVVTFLQPGDNAYVTFDMEGVEPFTKLAAEGGSASYSGRGLKIVSQQVAGPLFSQWPPASTEFFFGGAPIVQGRGDSFRPRMEDPQQQIRDLLDEALPVFRRPLSGERLQPFLEVASAAQAAGRDPQEVFHLTWRAMLSSPHFLLLDGTPGKLDDFALASRLSYFLWKSMPDAELLALAKDGQLSDPQQLSAQVERMLGDEKAKRFIGDFLGQWLRLYHVHDTTPDDGLYPEYDELLAAAIPQEPELFFAELLRRNLSVRQFVDADFTFVNRRLAKHYGMPDVDGQDFQRVTLDEQSPRGGFLTQAAILKTTANGTTTSPVMRGNFVLTNLLGTPPSPPPPDVGSIEPDTRGGTTIREILQAHRERESCNQCHRRIDPPGFALECFDPIGGFRTHYRATGGGLFGVFTQKSYHRGPAVDPSGKLASGQAFADIFEFKRALLGEQDQIARHFLSQLVVYATGGEVTFADRKQIEAMLATHRPMNYRVRDLIHAVVQSSLFRNL